MSLLTPSALLVWLALPLIYAGLVPLVRTLLDPSAPEDGAEKQALALMLAPFGLGAVLVLTAGLLPIDMPQVALPGFQGAVGGAFDAGPILAQRPGLTLPPLWVWAVGLYGMVAAYRLARLVRGRLQLGRVTQEAVPSGFADDVALTADLSVPIISAKGRILMPKPLAETLDDDALSLILAHERAHHARRDQGFFLKLAALDAVFWFHPGVRWQTARCRLAAELACDEAACQEYPALRKTYAELIVKTLHHAAGNALPCAPAVFSPRTKGEFGMRLTKIMRPRPAARKGRGAALAAAIILPLTLGQFALAQRNSSVVLMVAPVEEGRVTSRFGLRKDPFNDDQRTRHFGVDVANAVGTPIRAAGAGEVIFAGDSGPYGYRIDIQHANNIVTRYAQLQRVDVAVGDRVIPGQVIAPLGNSGRSTGPHLHFEVFVDGEHVDPESLVPAVERELRRN